MWVPVEWLAALAATAPAGRLSFSFDDGNASDVEQALPILERHGLTARFFVLAARLGTPGYLSAEDLIHMRAAGMEIGSHGLNHRDWRKIDAEELRAETVDSRAILSEAIGAPVSEAACPFGSYDGRVLRALRSAGYERVFTTEGGPARTGSFVMPRTSVGMAKPLEHWLTLAREAGARSPGPLLRAKRLAKRLI